MLNTGVERELHELLSLLPTNRQRQVVDFARGLARDRCSTDRDLARFAGVIDKQDLDTMAAAIELACEQVDPLDWV